MNLQIDATQFQITTWGDGAPLIVLHGFTGDGAGWQPIAELLAADYQVIAPDLPGHGATVAPDDVTAYEMPHVAGQLVQLLDVLKIETAHLWGYSMGGRLALYTAHAYPDRWRSLILESASPGLKTYSECAKRRQMDASLASFILREGITAFVDRWEKLPLWASQATLPAGVLVDQRQQRLTNNPDGLALSLHGMGTGQQPPLWDALPDVTCPTLLITGEHDSKFTALNADMVQKLPSARHVIIPSAGHNVHLEQPTVIVNTVRQFLDTRKS